MSDQDPDKLADELEHEAAELQDQSEKLQGDVADARGDWERKRRDQSVPGALAPSDPEETGADEGDDAEEGGTDGDAEEGGTDGDAESADEA